jgi:hypothetical protein
MQVVIEGRTMAVEVAPTQPSAKLAADLESRGFKPTQYAATGKRGAYYLVMQDKWDRWHVFAKL